MSSMKKVTLCAILLAIVVVTLGAYTRLTHAGLGCPDWPGCYGLVTVPQTSAEVSAAEQAFPGLTVETQKAWNEMIHRYFAGGLGLMIALIFMMAIKQRRQGTPIILPTFLLGLVIFQAALGMWTVTLKLMPIIVMGHLLGGFATLSCLFLLYLRLQRLNDKPLGQIRSKLTPEPNSRLREMTPWALLGIGILVVQIALGGWTSSNYAALTCTQLPICQPGWLEQLTFAESFNPIPPERETYEYGFLGHAERLTIHVTHRLGAIVTFAYLLWLGVTVYKQSQSKQFKKISSNMLILLFVQVGLGISNVWFSLPLYVAVAHNLIAACLLLSIIALSYSLMRRVQGVCYE